MDSQLTKQARTLVDQWRLDFIGVMQAMGDFTPEMTAHFERPPSGTEMLWWNQPFDLAADAGVWVGTAEKTWSALGQRILNAAGVESSSAAELKDTYLEVLRQSLGVLARSLGSRLGREIEASAGTAEEPEADQPFSCHISINTGDQELPGLAFFINREMLEALGSCANLNEADSSQTKTSGGDREEGQEFSDRACGTLDLLLDVEMPISVSFGRTQVRIQNVLKLITGSIIELDRAISEPVEVIVNNCIIARGEVVVVDGNYGVRVNEVMSRKERLQESRKYLLPAGSNRR